MRAFTSTPMRTLLDEVLARFARDVSRTRRGQLRAVVALTVVSTLTPFVGAAALRGVIDRLVPGRWTADLIPWLAMLSGAGLAHVVVGVRRVDRSQALAADVVGDLQVRLFDRFQQMPMTFFARVRPGAVATRVVSDLDALEQAVGNSLPAAVGGVVTLLVAMVAFAIVDWRLMVVGSLVIVTLPAMRGRLRAIRRNTDRVLSINARTYDAAFERLTYGGAQHVKLLGDPIEERHAFAALVEERQRLRAAMRSAVLTLDPIANGVLSVIIAIGVVIAVVFTDLDIGALVFFALAMRLAQQPIASAAAIQVDLAIAAVVLDRVYECLDFGDTPMSAAPAVRSGPPRESVADRSAGARVELDGVSFTFPSTRATVPPSLAFDVGSEGAEPVLDSVTLNVAAGEFVGIVGPTGSGKSSLAALLAGLLVPSAGEVRLDGEPVSAIDRQRLRREVAFVAQDCHLFNDTIYRNLTYGAVGVTHQEVVRACQAARIHSFVHSLTSGYNTVVGERGARLSGGQRQRLALARAIIARPRVLLLDEATAHVDVETEAGILEALDHHTTGMTRIVVAHRLNVVRRADRIVVLDRGRIVEAGPHDELVERDGPYRRAWEVQVGG